MHKFLVLHDNELTHTDLKPENILFVNSGFDLEMTRKVCCVFVTLILCLFLVY